MPFSYPMNRHTRRHGPAGYSSYASYRPWLRDEFLFRCVYCLKREQWDIVIKGKYHIDHYRPQVHNPGDVLQYENLLYACATCNLAKGKELIPNPCHYMLANSVIIFEDGRIKGTTSEAKRVIKVLGLDDTEYCEFRRLTIDTIALARQMKPDLFRRYMQYPDELPNLADLRPPDNIRPEGVQESYYAQRERRQLPAVY